MKIVKYKKDTEEGFPEYRFRIVDDNGKILDDAQGYGYKSEKNASKVMWYKFKGGKDKMEANKKKYRNNNKEVNFSEEEKENIEWNIFRDMKEGLYDENECLAELKEKGIEYKYGELVVTDKNKYMLSKIKGE